MSRLVRSDRFSIAYRWPLGLGFTSALLASLLLVILPAAAEELRLFVTIDMAQLIALKGEPLTAVSVTNPKIADVQVVTPNQILINAKGLGVTSLVVFYPRNRVQFYDLVVHPAPVTVVTAPLSNPTPHTVLVHRADRVSSHLFVRDGGELWVELGTVKPETTDDEKARKEIKK